MTDVWIGSDEWKTWWDGEPARVVRDVPSDGALGLELRLVELERTGERLLVGRSIPLPLRPGSALGVHLFKLPEGWDGEVPIAERELRFHSEPELYARPEECPVVTPDQRAAAVAGGSCPTTRRCWTRWRPRRTTSTPTSSARSCARSPPLRSSCRSAPTPRPAPPGCGRPPTRRGGRRSSRSPTTPR